MLTSGNQANLRAHWDRVPVPGSNGQKISEKEFYTQTQGREEHRYRPAPLFLLPGKFCRFPIACGFVLKEEPLSLAIDFVAVQIVLVRPVSVVRDHAQLSAWHFADICVVPEN